MKKRMAILASIIVISMAIISVVPVMAEGAQMDCITMNSETTNCCYTCTCCTDCETNCGMDCNMQR